MTRRRVEVPADAEVDVPSPQVRREIESFVERLSPQVTAFDFFVSGGDAQAVVDRMETLAPADFYAAVQSLGASGHLETMLGKLDWAGQCRFLAIAAEKGCIEQRRGSVSKAPLDPPGQPALYVMDSTLPRCVNDLIHEHSKAQVAQFNRAYVAYAERYETAIGGCRSLDEIQRLGRPAPTEIAWEYVDPRDPHARAYDIDWNRFTQASELGPLIAVSDRMAELNGERRDGSAWFELKLETVNAGSALELKFDSGTGEMKTRFGLAPSQELETGSLKVKGKMKVMNDGELELTAGVKEGGFVFEAMRGADAQGNPRGSMRVGPIKSGLSSGGASVEVIPISLRQGELGSVASADPSEAELRMGFKGTLKAEGMEAKLQTSIAVRVLSEQTVRRALSDEDVFGKSR